MVPITVLEARAGLSTSAGAQVEVRTPARARAGLALLAVVFWPGELTMATDVETAGWTEIATLTEGPGSIAVLRRECTDVEPASYAFDFTGVLAGNPPPMIALLVAAGVASADAVAAAAAIVAAATEFPAPSANAATYSDAALRVYVADIDSGFDADASDVILIAGVDTNEGSMLVRLTLPEAAGPVGVAAANTSEAASGIAATILLEAVPPLAAPRWDSDRASIGLPSVGV